MGLKAGSVSRLPSDPKARLSVLGSFDYSIGGHAQPVLSGSSQRLLALLVLRDRRMSRVAAAGTLWPEAGDSQAFSSLRTALVRLDPMSRKAVVASTADLRLADSVGVDFRDSQSLAHRLLDFEVVPQADDLNAAALALLSMDLLPDWYDDWVLVEAEDWRQLRLHALEALAQRLTTAGRLAEAAGAALAAVNAGPLRETSRRALINIHLAEGNQSEAIAEFDRYRTLLQAELGVEPTEGLRDLIPTAHPDFGVVRNAA
jgi:DNA-binding SARP family transcriptional activator